MTGANAGRRGRSFHDDERSVAVVVGFMLLFAVLVLAIGVWQLNVVPAESQAAEAEHDREVAADMAALDDAVQRVGDRGGTQSQVVTAGLSYPDRTFLRSPPPTSGVVSTGQPMTVTVANVSVDEGEEGTNAATYWNNSSRTLEHRPLAFSPIYAETTDPAFRLIEPSGLVTRQRDGRSARDQQIVDGNEIGFTAVSGDISRSSDAVSLDLAPNSAPARTLRVESTADSPLTFHVQTSLGQAQWERLLRDEPASVTVTSEETAPHNEAEITLDPGEYNLRLAEASVGAVDDPEPAYLVRETSTGANPDMETVVEVRDEYNNPLPNAEVKTTVGDNETFRSDADGRVAVTHEERAAFWVGDGSAADGRIVVAGGVESSIDTVDADTSPPDATVPDGARRFSVSFSAGADDTLDDATIRLYDGDDRVTTETVDLDGEEDSNGIDRANGTWSSPWLENVSDPRAEVVVSDVAGRTSQDDFDEIEIPEVPGPEEPSEPDQPSDPAEIVPGSGGYTGPGTSRGGAAFQLRNAGPGAITITGVRVTNVDGTPPANRLVRTAGAGDPHASTVHIAGDISTGRLNVDDLVIGAGPVAQFPTASRATLSGGSTARVTLHEFRGGGGGGSARDMTGYTVTVELSYTVAGQPGTRTRTVTIGPLNQRAS